MRKRKYDYVKVIQGYYTGYGWEDLSLYYKEEYHTIKADYKEYCIAEPQTPHRIISRRILKEEE